MSKLGQEQHPVLGRVAMLGTKREMRGAGAGGGVYWELEECSGPAQGNDSGKLSPCCHLQHVRMDSQME